MGAALAPRWHWVKAGFLPITIFATLMGIATIVPWDRFNHSHVAFVPLIVRRGIGSLGVVASLLSILLFLLPDVMIGLWPWMLTP